MRRSEGVERLVRRARRERRVLMDVFEGIVRGIVLLPETVLTKICIVSSDSELDELMLDERRMMAVVERAVGGYGAERTCEAGDDDGVVGEW
jgi:hypothetical protein